MKQASRTEGLLFVEVSRCMACHSCEMACAVAHSASKDLVSAMGEEPRPSARMTVEAVGGMAVPLQCRHCEDAPCVTICPTRAIEKLGPNQPVIVTAVRCIGCRLCLMVCPFGVIRLERDGKAALKCDLCMERLAEGQDPACVTACPTGALRFGEIGEGIAERCREAARKVAQAQASAGKIRAGSMNGIDKS
jgi:carbon-monoxide dehydrogenase iron sulfur subunit